MTKDDAIAILEMENPFLGTNERLTQAFDMAITALKSVQPEIIRCEDCEHWDTTWTNDYSPDYHYCPIIDGVRKGDFYCADAERRKDG